MKILDLLHGQHNKKNLNLIPGCKRKSLPEEILQSCPGNLNNSNSHPTADFCHVALYLFLPFFSFV